MIVNRDIEDGIMIKKLLLTRVENTREETAFFMVVLHLK